MTWIDHLKEKINTTSFQLNCRYILILLSTVVFIGATAIVSVSYQLYKSTETEVRHIESGLAAAAKEKHPDWKRTIRNVIDENHPNYYVHIETPDGRTIYSEGSESITDDDKKLPDFKWFSSISIKHFSMPIYHHETSYHHYTFKIYVKMAAIHEFMESTIKVLILSAVAGILFGSLAIYRFSRRLSKPLAEVTETIKLATSTENLQVTVPIPEQPQEIKDLAIAFNHLMHRLNEQIQREKNFVSDASHELRTPLAAIRGHVKLIMRHGNKHPEVIEQSAQFINQESLRMQRLMDQLLMIARLDRSSMSVTPVNLSMIAKSISEDNIPAIRQRFTVDIGDSITAIANEDNVHQVIISLLENAGKYTPDDGWINLTLKQDDRYAYVIVRDSGPSIPDDEKKKVFERFYRVDKSRSSKKGGSGLGLSIAKQLVEIDGGKIWAADIIPAGCQFIVRYRRRRPPINGR